MNLKVGVEGVSLSPSQCGCSPAGPALNPGGFSSLYLKPGCCSAVGVHTVINSELVSKAAGKMNKKPILVFQAGH